MSLIKIERHLIILEGLQKFKNCTNMLGDGMDINVLKYGVICILSLLAFIVVFIFKLIFGSYVIGIIIFVVLVWLLIFKIGITIMYPGSSNYFTSDIQIRIGNQLSKNFHHLGHCFQFVAECIVQRRVEFTSAQWNLREKVMSSIHSAIEMLSMFENNLSPRKTKMLQIFRHLLQQLEARHSPSQGPSAQQSLTPLKSIAQFLQFPKRIAKTADSEHRFLCQRVKRIIQLSNALQQIVQTYQAPQKTLDFLKFKFLSEKLYEVRFGYQRWNHLFEYEVHLINNHGYVLECAVIRKCKNYQLMGLSNQQNEAPVLNGKYVMFCNPNGVYIQFFAVQNTYIREYLRQGYQLILWNYRGYGQSTGTPSITKSQTDAVKVYNYFTGRGLQIELVHGYSIGGCAAIGLVNKLEAKEKQRSKSSHLSNPQLRAQALPNNVKLLIVDRSFSSIGDMAIEFGSTLHRLARIVFTFQNKNLSQQFFELKAEKLLLWDKYDEVIPDTASVKCGILMKILGSDDSSGCKNCSNCMKSESQGQLNEEVSVLINQRDQDNEDSDKIGKKTTQRFINSLKILLKNSSQINKSTQTELNTNHEYDPSTEYQMDDNLDQKSNDCPSLTEQIVNQVFNAMQLVDGGGCLLAHPVTQLRKTLLMNPISFDFRCKSYVLGLAYYGSVIPVDVAFQKKTEIQLHTIKKIEQVIKTLTKIADQNSEASKIMQPQLAVAIQNIIKTFTQIKSIVEQKFILPENKKFGKLVALSSGHNGSLPNEQLKMLMKYVRQVCAHNQDSNLGVQLNTMQRLQQQSSSNLNNNSNIRQNEVNNSTQMTRNSAQHNFLE